MSRKSSASLCTLQCAKNEKITECRIGTYIAGKIIVGPCIVWKVSKKILQNRGFYIIGICIVRFEKTTLKQIQHYANPHQGPTVFGKFLLWYFFKVLEQGVPHSYYTS